MTRSDAALDHALLDAHSRGDQAALVRLYAEAGGKSDEMGDIDAACFYWTHAYIFALEDGDPQAGDLHARLKAHGREE
ncbi:hypothetical protein DDZ14_06600 [Maritimibacter sp. 55A14]|uniref:hypothetical protein n=1 Tax=Maritimibacter sp. 55A14 TaxID=2174844 RepID=UPI000D61E8B0|nr:hypothetical protein [Maritimibacter sp. 55A14]PWE33083.1 hypothetical protein DDZ14_06600 [Maritimibacter sp. 55A14]